MVPSLNGPVGVVPSGSPPTMGLTGIDFDADDLVVQSKILGLVKQGNKTNAETFSCDWDAELAALCASEAVLV